MAELAALASAAHRRRIVAALAELPGHPGPLDRLTAGGLCRRRGAGFRVLYRWRGEDLVVAALRLD